jgi:hypothetical protein
VASEESRADLDSRATKATLGTVSPSFQVSYAWQILERKTGLSVEWPLVVPVHVSGETLSRPAFKSTGIAFHF